MFNQPIHLIMKKTGLLLAGTLLLLFSAQMQLFSQSSEIFDQIRNEEFQTEWSVYYQDDVIRISLKYSDCSDPANGIYPEYLLFKIENLTAGRVHAYREWSFDYDGRRMSKNDTDEELVKVTLEGMEILEASCSNDENKKLRIYVQDKMRITSSALTDFALIELNVFEL